jgi:biotin carboxyl carrier protein
MSGTHPAILYYVTVKGNEHVVEIAEGPEGEIELKLDGRPVDADLVPLQADGLHSLLLDGHSREMILEREGDRTFVGLDGERIEVRVQDEVSRALSAIEGARPAGPTEVTAPMPGVVVEVRVQPGDAVQAGQPVVVVEAMKMQNELAAETDGTVERVAVKAGDAVDGGAVLVVVTPVETP